MDQLERTVVQLPEPKRLISLDDVAHGRLALLLLDNAAETSLRRSAQTKIQWPVMYITRPTSSGPLIPIKTDSGMFSPKSARTRSLEPDLAQDHGCG